MIQIIDGPLVAQPQSWVLVFDTVATGRFLSIIPFGHYKHVRAYTYVPFLHVWLFFDPHWGGTDLIVTGKDAGPALSRAWIAAGRSDLMHVQFARGLTAPPIGGWCVPQIKRLLGIRCGALRPDALWRHCLKRGGAPFERDRAWADRAVVGQMR